MSYVVLCINICIIYSWNCLSSWCVWASNSIHCSSISIHFSCSDIIIIWSLLFCTVIIFSNSLLILWPHLFLTFASLTCSYTLRCSCPTSKRLCPTTSWLQPTPRWMYLTDLCVHLCIAAWSLVWDRTVNCWCYGLTRHVLSFVIRSNMSRLSTTVGGSVECLGPSILSRAFPI